MPSFKSFKSFTLIELLISLFILSVGVFATLEAFPFGVSIQKSAQMTSTALYLAQAKAEELLSQSYSSIIVGIFEEDYGFLPGFDSYRREAEISYFDPNNPDVPPVEDLGIKKITVNVFWHFPLAIGEKTVKISTLLSKR